MSRFQAWRFHHPDFDTGASAIGLVLSPNGTIATIDQDEAVRQSLRLLLSTRPGERVMRPDYGCELDSLSFSPNDATTAGVAMHYVRRAVRRFEPRIEILSLNAAADPLDQGRLNIELHYLVKPTRNESLLNYQIALQGGAEA